MKQQQTTLFISDLHLDAAQPDVAQAFLNFLKTQLPLSHALYILGDFFEVWIGDDDPSVFNANIRSALKAMTEQGCHIYFMHGNRDLLIGKRFLEETGCELLSDPSVIDLYGRPTLLMHGDSLCLKDTQHRIFRGLAHNTLLQKVFLMQPLNCRRKIVQWLRHRSQVHTQSVPDYIMDVDPKAVKQAMQRAGVCQMIHGHTHRPDVHEVELVRNQLAKRIVLGAWEKTTHVLRYNSDGSHSFERQLIL